MPARYAACVSRSPDRIPACIPALPLGGPGSPSLRPLACSAPAQWPHSRSPALTSDRRASRAGLGGGIAGGSCRQSDSAILLGCRARLCCVYEKKTCSSEECQRSEVWNLNQDAPENLCAVHSKPPSLAIHACGAFAALLAVAAILNFNSAGQISELFEYNHVAAHSDDFAGTVEPATLNDDEVLAFELIIHIKCIVLR